MGWLAGFRLRRFLTAKEREQIAAALAEANRQTQARIGLFIEGQATPDPQTRARGLCDQWDLPQGDRARAVLVYVCASSRRFAIVGGEEVRQAAPGEFWELVNRDLQHHFAEGRYCDGIFKAIAQLALQLEHHFPRDPEKKTPESSPPQGDPPRNSETAYLVG